MWRIVLTGIQETYVPGGKFGVKGGWMHVKRILWALLVLTLAAVFGAPPAAAAGHQGQLCVADQRGYDGSAICWFPFGGDPPLDVNLGQVGLNNAASSFFLGGLDSSIKCRVVLYKYTDQAGPSHVWPYRAWDDDALFTNPYNGDTLHYKRADATLGDSYFSDGTPIGNSASSFTMNCIVR